MKKLSERMRAARQRRERRFLDGAVAYHGSKAALARALGVSTQAVQHWYKSCNRVPLERCPQIELATCGHIQCEELREDYSLLEIRPYRRCPAVSA